MDIKGTIVILNYMKAARAVENIRCLMSQETVFNFKLFVIDNSCDPRQAKILEEETRKYPNAELVINKKNLGYAGGHSVIDGKELGDYIVSVNPDILFKEKDALQKMMDYMDEHRDIGILGPQQINDSGELAMSVRAFPKFYLQVARRMFLRHLPVIKDKVAYDEMRHLDYSVIQDVDWLQDSCVAIRRDLWEKVGGYNGYYFLFMADTEICVRAWKEGYRVVYYPETRVYADGIRLSAGGITKFFSSWIIRQHVIDSLRYQLKHFCEPNPREAYYGKKREINKEK